MDVHGDVRLALDEKAVRVAARSAQGRGRGKRRRRLHARLCQSRARAAHARHPEGGAAWPLGHAVERGLPRGARVRTHLDGDRQRLCPAADGLLSRAHAGGAGGGEIHRHDLSRDLGRRPHRHRDGAALPGAAGRIRSGRRRDFCGAGGGARRRGAGAQLRHGRHHGQDLPDRRLQAAHRAAVRGRPRRPLPQGIGPAGAHPGDRDGRDRRRRRLDRAPRCAEAHDGRAGQRRRRAGPGLLRPRRHAADGDRRRCRARHDRSARLCRRQHHARSRRGQGRAGARHRRGPRALDRDGEPTPSTRWCRRTWPMPRACTPSSAAPSSTSTI